MTSRKQQLAKWGTLVIAVIQILGLIVSGDWRDPDKLSQAVMILSGAITALFGITIHGIAKEDAATKSNPATPPVKEIVRQQINEVSQGLRANNEEKIDDIMKRGSALMEQRLEEIAKRFLERVK